MTSDRGNRLQRYLDDLMPRNERDAFEQELLGDPEFMATAYDEVSVRQALSEAGANRKTALLASRSKPHMWLRPVLTLAAAASIAFVVLILPRPDGNENFRGKPASSPEAVAPVGEVPHLPGRFVWTRDLSALSYRLEIFDPDGARLFVTATADTFHVPGPDFQVPFAGSWRATSLDSVGVGARSTGRVDYRLP